MNQVSPLFGLSQRMPPTNIVAEQALLGAIMANPKAYPRVSDFLRPEHFADPVHQAIYTAAARRIEAGGIADAITLRAEFEHSGVLEQVGGVSYLTQLLSSMVAIISAGEYGRAIHDAWLRRELIEAGENLVNRAFAGSSGEVEQMIGEAAGALERIGAGGAADRGPVMLAEAVDAALASWEAAMKRGGPSGLLTGMPSVDDVMGGLDGGTLNVLAGRPGSGKSSLGWQWAISIARAERQAQADALAAGISREKGGVACFSLEMSAMQLGRRALASAARVSIGALRRGQDADSVDRLFSARRELRSLPLSIDDAGGLTMAEINIRCRRMKRQHGLSLIMIDHLQIVGADAADNRNGSTAAVTGIAHGAKALGKRFDCPVLLLSQLNRGVEGRDDKRPTKADLRQSGAIEEDADSVAFVYRPELHMAKSAPEQREGEKAESYSIRVNSFYEMRDRSAGVAELILDKVRDGEPSMVPLRFDGSTASFSEIQNSDGYDEQN